MILEKVVRKSTLNEPKEKLIIKEVMKKLKTIENQTLKMINYHGLD
jgi:hypothetical protein